MYIHAQDTECSKCKAINNHEYVSREDEALIRCRSCGHEKITSKITYTDNGGSSIIYDVNKNDKQVF